MEILIKSIASAIPCYAMSMFKFSKGLCTRLNKMTARFWWGASESRRRMHWKSWHYLTKPKLLGGLNFRDFEQINHSLLASLCWRLLHSQNLIAFQVLKGRYFPYGTLLTASKGSAPIWCWSGILHGRDLLLRGGRWLVGTGTTIPTMDSPWLPSLEYPTPIPRPLTLSIPPRVSDFITNEGFWNIEMLSTYFSPRSVTAILSIPLPQVWVPDRFVWLQSRDGEYTAASGYRFTRMSLTSPRLPTAGPSIHDSRLWAKVWSLPIQPKLRFFLWKLIHGILPTSDALIHRRIDVDSRCPVCGISLETISHLFFSCIVAQTLASSLGCTSFIGLDRHPIIFLRSLLETDVPQTVKLTYFWWRLWKSRNLVVFEGYQYTIEVLQRQFLDHWIEGVQVFTQPSRAPSPSVSALAQPQQRRSTDWVISVDAAVHEDNINPSASYGALGFVVRRRCGSLSSATGQVIHHIWDPFVLEFLAVRQALFIAQVRSNDSIHINSDSADVVRLLTSSSRDIRVGQILHECRSLLRSLPLVSISHVSRLDNSAAHSVAREALHYPDTSHLLSLAYSIPPYV
ncbi:Uncharacterized mitochondrial protein AtMg00310 [Linum grandiflorum]